MFPLIVPKPERPSPEQRRSDRLHDCWISIMHTLVGVEYAIVRDAYISKPGRPTWSIG